MALNANELFASAAGKGAEIRMVVKRNKVGTLAAQVGAPLLPKATPLAYNSATDLWTVYTQPSDAAIFTLTNAGTGVDAGSLNVLIDGLAINLAFDVTAAEMQTEVNAALAAAGKPYTIAAAATAQVDLGVAAAIITVTFSENAGAPSIELDSSGLLDALVPEPAGVTLAITDAGTALSGTSKIRGFVQDADGVQSHATNEVQAVVALELEVHRDDVNTAAIRAVLGGVPTEGELDTALRDQDVRGLGMHIRGLSNVS